MYGTTGGFGMKQKKEVVFVYNPNPNPIKVAVRENRQGVTTLVAMYPALLSSRKPTLALLP